MYEHIRPQDFEHRLRQDLVDELTKGVRKRFPDVEVHAFGSFRSKLYLPTGDMDLVICSTSFLHGGPPKYHAKSSLYQLKAFLRKTRLASDDEIEVVARAKVPLVKYIDNTTALKVDISFENATGIEAVDTFLEWKEQYPAMPVLVTLVKHFLFMRALNEPINGGIGGFTVICLVVSMLQLMPPVESGDMTTEHHLGDLLMHFFDLYGNKFNYEATAISLKPPGYLPKVSARYPRYDPMNIFTLIVPADQNKVSSFVYKNPDRLSVIDPNDSSNDISGGSSNISAICRVFADAHQALVDRMHHLSQCTDSDKKNASILSVVFEGDYTTFRLQREYMRKVHASTYAKAGINISLRAGRCNDGTTAPSRQPTSGQTDREDGGITAQDGFFFPLVRTIPPLWPANVAFFFLPCANQLGFSRTRRVLPR